MVSKTVGNLKGKQEEVRDESEEAVDELMADADNFDDEEEDFGAEIDELEAEGSDMPDEEEDEAEEEEEEETEQHKEAQVEPEGKLVEVTSDYVSRITQTLASGALVGVHRITRLFAGVFNETTASASVHYQCNDSEVFREVFNLFFNAADVLLKGDQKHEKYTAICRSYVKQMLSYLNRTKEEAVVASCLNSIRDSATLLQPFQTLTRKFVKLCLATWTTADLPLARLAAYRMVKAIFDSASNDAKLKLTKSTLKAFTRFASSISWRNYDHFIFMKNCLKDLILSDTDIGYMALFERLREFSQMIVEQSKHKVCSQEQRRSEKAVQFPHSCHASISRSSGLLIRSVNDSYLNWDIRWSR